MPIHASQPIIKTLARLTNNFTNPDGSSMLNEDATFETLILKKLETDSEFRETFINQTLDMHNELLEDLITDINKSIKNHKAYSKFVHSDDFGIVEFGDSKLFSNLFEKLHLLKLMFASEAFMGPNEKSAFRAKIIKQLALSEMHKKEINKSKAALGLSEVTGTPLEAELAQSPLTETASIRILKPHMRNYAKKLNNAKKEAIERIKIINMAIDAKVLLPQIYMKLIHDINTLPSEKLEAPPVMDLILDAKVRSTIEQFLNINIEAEPGPKLIPVLDLTCSSLFH